MRHFSREIDMSDAEQLREYLREHFRYNTMNCWNNSTSYAHCIKLGRLPLTAEQRDSAYELLDVENVYDSASMLIDAWEEKHARKWQVGFNGRSSGYLVLYQGGVAADGRACCYPGRSVDQDADFDEWELEDLQDRAKIVASFDELCDQILDDFIYTIDNYTVKEITVNIPKTVKVLEPK